MRKFFLACFVMTATLCLAASGFALEKAPIQDTLESPQGGWNAAATCVIQYYNRCNLWSWVWSNWGPNDRIGQCVDACCAGDLAQTVLRVFGSAPTTGYGFTGTVTIYPADANCCPNFSSPLASQAWFPGTTVVCYPNATFDVHAWAVSVPSRFAIVYEFGTAGGGGAGSACGAAFGTDMPASGPTGPQGCGTCYPCPRVNHSFYWGNSTTVLCPGSVFNDGVGDAQIRLDISMICNTISVEPQNWSNIKNLYR